MIDLVIFIFLEKNIILIFKIQDNKRPFYYRNQ
jgi:hypothetical protein